MVRDPRPGAKVKGPSESQSRKGEVDPVNDELIELKLDRRRRPASGPDDALRTLVDQLLKLVADIATRDNALKPPPDLRDRISVLREVVGRGRETAEPVADLAEATLDACEEYFSRARERAIDREIEFIDIIDTLREAVRSLAGNTSSFTEDMLGTSQRFHELLQIDDLHAIKERIVVETKTLRQRVVEKQQSDKDLYDRLASRIENLQHSLQRAEEDASVDPLTGVANRRTFDRVLSEWASSESTTAFSIAMFDLDDFKKINDAYGHPVGDRVLLVTAGILRNSVRTGDLVARYGGEEFVVLLRDCPIDLAEARLGKILESIATTRYEYEDDGQVRALRFTASCGLTESSEGESPAALIRRADDALYDAKKKGKNRVAVRKRSIFQSLFGRHAS